MGKRLLMPLQAFFFYLIILPGKCRSGCGLICSKPFGRVLRNPSASH
jgi:hypothetical protein